ncbi:molybdopterin biosynthesis protein [Pelagivirga sediminicola]|uniref:Molybdopterin biosynthesis protein n=1 Tax=Pelagivirga sediminicola TaxID=2170575 RepID=A0A2T7GBE0_9RHOB|nr:molybdopterin-binding protein [Pelagivirga sediminicola]PVA11698.1 molybdopterin biosynthesis protein [Pelagivirga sediminicola]
MIFGPVPLAEAAGAILAHSVAVPGGRLRKGLLLEPEHLDQLRGAGLSEVTVARLEDGDVGEDDAARHLAEALADGAPGIRLGAPGTGRVNLIADGPGVVQLDAAAIHAANGSDPMITIATVPDMQQMRRGGMIATVKIISYAVPEAAISAACAAARGAVRLAAPQLASASLIVTETAAGAGDKGVAAIAARLEALQTDLADVIRVPHEPGAMAAALQRAPGDLVLILTASATSDSHDTGPAALRQAGGHVIRFGMPVDPGNLLFLGHLGPRPVIGLPGCARAPSLNGADWVLSRVICGIEVSAVDIAGMGVGGLLKEIPTRPMPRRGR